MMRWLPAFGLVVLRSGAALAEDERRAHGEAAGMVHAAECAESPRARQELLDAVMNGESLHIAGRLTGYRQAFTTNRSAHLDDATLNQTAERVATTVGRKPRDCGVSMDKVTSVPTIILTKSAAWSFRDSINCSRFRKTA